jgi:excisionase family DNA binding protein
MVKVMGNLNRWLDKESIREILDCSPESVDLLINGLSKSIATTHNGLVLINLNDLRKYLSEVKKLADPLLEGSASKKIKRLKGENKPKPERMNRKQRIDAGYLTGKQVAEKLGCSHADIIEFIKKHELKAGKFGRGWYINPKDLEEFLRKNQDKIKSVQSKKEDGVEQKDAKSQEGPAKEEKKTEDSKEDPSSSDPVPNAVVSKENIIIVDPSKDSIRNEEQNKESSESESDPPVQADRQISNQPEDKNQESIKNNDPVQGKKKENEEEHQCSFITIKKTRYGCKIDDVAMALKLSINTPMRWITDNQVKTITGPGTKGDERYIEPKSLEEFLFKQRNTIVTFSETKILHWPDVRNPTPAR